MSETLANIFQIGEAMEQRLAQLEETLEEQVNKIVDISRIGSVFTSYLDLDLVLPMIIETGLRIVKGEVGEVAIFNFHGQPKSISWGLTSEIIRQISTENHSDLIEQIKSTGNSATLNEIKVKAEGGATDAELNINSLIISPLKSQNDVVGYIAIANKEDQEDFSSDDTFSLEMLGSFVAVAVKNAELHMDALIKQKLEHELQLAEQVQSTLMPEKIIKFDGLEVFSHYNPAGQVGGDFYDTIDLGDGRYLIVVADVSNKGVPAALIMSSTRSYIRVMAQRTDSLADLVSQVNNLLCRDVEKLSGMFVTTFLGLIDTKNGTLISVNAGHPPAYLFRGSEIITLKTGGPFVGQFANIPYQEIEIEIKSGDKIIIYTDGIFECANAEGEMLGLKNALKFFEENITKSWPLFVERLSELLAEYSYDKSRIDDTTLLMIEIKK